LYFPIYLCYLFRHPYKQNYCFSSGTYFWHKCFIVRNMVHHVHANFKRYHPRLLILCVATIAGGKTGKQGIFKVCSPHLSVAYLSSNYPIYFLPSSFQINLSNTIKSFPSLNRSAWNLPIKELKQVHKFFLPPCDQICCWKIFFDLSSQISQKSLTDFVEQNSSTHNALTIWVAVCALVQWRSCN
jgi:hypothetical protein